MEVAMGLETVHPEILPKLNKRMTLELFAGSAETLRSHDIDLRAFILVKPPFMDEAEAGYWARQSIDYAFTCGASVAALIPTRAGNGGMEVLEVRGEFSPPKLSTLEAVAAYGIKKKNGRVFVDIWDALEWVECPHCLNARVSRLQDMNLRQVILPPIQCVHCCGADA